MTIDTLAQITGVLGLLVAGGMAGHKAREWPSMSWADRLVGYLAVPAFAGLVAWNVLLFIAVMLTMVGSIVVALIS